MTCAGERGTAALVTTAGSCVALLLGLMVVVAAADLGVAAARARAGADAAALAAAAALPLAGGDGELAAAAVRLAAANGARVSACCMPGGRDRLPSGAHGVVVVEVAVPARTALLRAASVEASASAAAGLRPGTAPAHLPELAAGAPAPTGGRLQVPVRGHLTSGFGWRRHPVSGARRLHAGVDLAAPSGTPVLAAADGAVVRSGWQGGYGLAVVLDHGHGLVTRYAHLSGIGVVRGQPVHRGQRLGSLGCTGTCTGPHLHFEVRNGGRPTNPLPYLFADVRSPSGE